MSVGGAGADAKIALSVVVQALRDRQPIPVAASLECGVADISLPDETRTSRRKRPVVGPWMARMMRETYFLGADPDDPVATPGKHPRPADFPPLLVLTGGLDTLRHEMRTLAEAARAAGVQVTHHQFPESDHGFTHVKPVETNDHHDDRRSPPRGLRQTMTRRRDTTVRRRRLRERTSSGPLGT